MPLKASHTDVRGHCIADGAMGEAQGPPCSWVTDLRVPQRPGSRRMRGGRARWQRAHETLNTRQHQGDHGDHHDGHGPQHLSGRWAMVRRRALVVEQPQPRWWAVLHAGGATRGRQRRRWKRRRAWCDDEALESRRPRRAALGYGLKTSKPTVAGEASSSRHRCSGAPPPSHPAIAHRFGKATPP